MNRITLTYGKASFRFESTATKEMVKTTVANLKKQADRKESKGCVVSVTAEQVWKDLEAKRKEAETKAAEA